MNITAYLWYIQADAEERKRVFEAMNKATNQLAEPLQKQAELIHQIAEQTEERYTLAANEIANSFAAFAQRYVEHYTPLIELLSKSIDDQKDNN